MNSAPFFTTSPFDQKNLQEYFHHSDAEIEVKLRQIHSSWVELREDSISLRAERLRKLAGVLRKEAPLLAQMMTAEMGKPIADSLAEVEKSAGTCEYVSDQLPAWIEDQVGGDQTSRFKILKQSWGPILAVMPWNYPLWQLIRVAAPAIGIGNPIVLKHANSVAGSAEIIERIFSQVDPRLLTNLRLTHEQVEKVILDSRIRAVTLTGSERAGKSVAEVAGRVLKKTVLELGGSDAYLVLADADIEQAAMSCARARMENNGQSCIAAKRFVVEESVLESFLESFSRAIIEMKRGDPALPATRLGPLASGKFRKSLLQQCENLEKLGAKKIFEAESFPEFSLNHPGAFFPARIYRADPEIQAHFQEELFGPVALVFAFKTMPEALGIANNTPYGLGGAIFSEDLDRAEQWAKNLDCGMVAINSQLKSDARRPFGGVKNSGYGRELGLYGFNEFCNIKSLVLS